VVFGDIVVDCNAVNARYSFEADGTGWGKLRALKLRAFKRRLTSFLTSYGIAEQVAETCRLLFQRRAPAAKAGSIFYRVTVCLKAYPDTNREFFPQPMKPCSSTIRRLFLGVLTARRTAASAFPVQQIGNYSRILLMSQAAPAMTRSPEEVVRQSPVSQAPNGICYAIVGEVTVATSDLERMVAAVPEAAAAALQRKAYYFVPLTVNQGEDTVIADRYDVGLSDNAVCHRNIELGDSQCVFISTRLMDDKFSVAFEFYINVGHAVVEKVGVSQEFSDLVWKQAEAGVRGETSLDAWESRKAATSHQPDAEKHKNEYLSATFSDAISIYLLSLFIDVDYYDLRERDYPLLAPAQMAERLRKVAELFPANPGFEFAIYYKRRS
jgi:hypothetical protein